jgi:hypothetical protein
MAFLCATPPKALHVDPVTCISSRHPLRAAALMHANHVTALRSEQGEEGGAAFGVRGGGETSVHTYDGDNLQVAFMGDISNLHYLATKGGLGGGDKVSQPRARGGETTTTVGESRGERETCIRHLMRGRLPAQQVRSVQQHNPAHVIAKVFLSYGVGTVAKMRGTFAFVIYDALSMRVFAARDPSGVWPLYQVGYLSLPFMFLPASLSVTVVSRRAERARGMRHSTLSVSPPLRRGSWSTRACSCPASRWQSTSR